MGITERKLDGDLKEELKLFRLNHSGTCPMGSAERDCPYVNPSRINYCLEDCEECDKYPEQMKKLEEDYDS